MSRPDDVARTLLALRPAMRASAAKTVALARASKGAAEPEPVKDAPVEDGAGTDAPVRVE